MCINSVCITNELCIPNELYAATSDTFKTHAGKSQNIHVATVCMLAGAI